MIIIIGIFLPSDDKILRVLLKIALLPLSVGLGFEFIMLAGKHRNWLTRALSAPGLWMQRITTQEPTDDIIEVGIESIKAVLFDTEENKAEEDEA